MELSVYKTIIVLPTKQRTFFRIDFPVLNDRSFDYDLFSIIVLTILLLYNLLFKSWHCNNKCFVLKLKGQFWKVNVQNCITTTKRNNIECDCYTLFSLR